MRQVNLISRLTLALPAIMLVSKTLIAACGWFATHAAAQKEVFEIGFQPINQEILGSETSYKVSLFLLQLFSTPIVLSTQYMSVADHVE